MVQLERIELRTYRHKKTGELLALQKAATIPQLVEEVLVRKVDTRFFIRSLIPYIMLSSRKGRAQATLEWSLDYVLEQKVSNHVKGSEQVVQRMRGRAEPAVKEKTVLRFEVDFASDYSCLTKPDKHLWFKRISWRVRLLYPRATPWKLHQIKFLYTPWGD